MHEVLHLLYNFTFLSLYFANQGQLYMIDSRKSTREGPVPFYQFIPSGLLPNNIDMMLFLLIFNIISNSGLPALQNYVMFNFI